MKIVKVSEVTGKPDPPAPGVTAKIVYDSEYAQALHMTMKPGESVDLHVTPVDVFVYFIDGEGLMQIGDEVQAVSKDMVVDSPAFIQHRIMNPGKKDLNFLSVKLLKSTERQGSE